MAENDVSTSQTDSEGTSTNRNCPPNTIRLMPYKCFYFLFFSAVGSLFPYLAIFYKQLWLSAQQTGILIGIRPLLQLVSSSVWGIIADKSDKSKWIFLVSLVAWLSSNFSLSLVKHPIDRSPCRDNGTLTMLEDALHITTKTVKKNSTELYNKASSVSTGNSHVNRNVFGKNLARNKRFMASLTLNKKPFEKGISPTGNNLSHKIKATFQKVKNERKFDELNAHGHYPWSLHMILNLKMVDKTRMQYKGNNGIFFLLLIITVVGTLVTAPAIPFADTATLQVLGDDLDFYGKQRQWGSLGWGISCFVMGSIVSTLQEKSNCNVPSHIDYTPCFYVFAILMTTAIIPAAFFRFDDRQTSSESIVERVRGLLNVDCIFFLVTILFCGCSWGLIQTFLLWHLQDLGGTQFLFSIIAAIQCLSEVVCYHSAGYGIRILGHYRLLYVSLLFLSLRLVLYGVIKNPWLVPPIELFHGMSTTLLWSLAVSFIGLRPGVTTTMQGLLSGVHWGLGFGGGGILSGLLVTCIGSKNTFILFGIISLVNLLVLGTTRNLKCFHNQSEESLSLLERSDNENESIPLESRAMSTIDCPP